MSDRNSRTYVIGARTRGESITKVVVPRARCSFANRKFARGQRRYVGVKIDSKLVYVAAVCFFARLSLSPHFSRASSLEPSATLQRYARGRGLFSCVALHLSFPMTEIFAPRLLLITWQTRPSTLILIRLFNYYMYVKAAERE